MSGGGPAAAFEHIDMHIADRSKAQEFEDIVLPLLENRASSFIISDEHVRRSFSGHSRSFITAQDVGGSAEHSPASRRRPVTRSVSSLGESMLGLDGAADDDDYLLSHEYLQWSAYDCLLMANHALLREALSDCGTTSALHALRRQLDISQAHHELSLHSIAVALERVQGRVPARSALFRLYLIESVVLHRRLSQADDCSVRVAPELRHLAIFSSAMHFVIRRTRTQAAIPHSADAQCARLSAQLSHDTKSMRSKLVVFGRSPTAENADAVRALLAGMIVRYTQTPFVDPDPAAEAPTAGTPAAAAAAAAAAGSDVFYGGGRLGKRGSADDVVLTEQQGMSGLAVLNCSGDQDEDVPLVTLQAESPRHAESSPRAPSVPLPHPDVGARAAGYTFPLNVMVYSTLFHTFFVNTEVAGEEGDKAAGTPGKAGMSKAQRRKHGIYRSRMQEVRMKNVVDVLASLRSMFGVTEFLHACCFIHALFVENVEGSLTVPELYRLLSVDCYYYPGFKLFCRVPDSSLTLEDVACRNQVITNLQDEFSLKLSDYHAELAAVPENLLFIAKLHTVILHFVNAEEGSGNELNIASPASCQSASQHSQNKDRRAAAAAAAAAATTDEVEPSVKSRCSGRTNGGTPPVGADDLQMPELESADTESDDAGVRVDTLAAERDRQLEPCLEEIRQSYGPDVADMVGSLLGKDGQFSDVGTPGSPLALMTSCELVALITSSTIKHYIRVKHKVRTSRKTAGESSGPRHCDVWIDQLNATAVPRAASNVRAGIHHPSQSISSLAADVGGCGRSGAARLAPSTPRQSPAGHSGITLTLQKINNNFRLTIDQIRHLLEVLLIEVHTDSKCFSSCLVAVFPPAVAVVLSIYSKLLSEDVDVTLGNLNVRTTLRPHENFFFSGGLPDATPIVTPPPQPPPPPSTRDAPVRAGGYSSPPRRAGHDTSPSSGPPPPRRSSSPPLPAPGRLSMPGLAAAAAASSVDTAATAGFITITDVVALSMLVTNLVYSMLLLELLQANMRHYFVQSSHTMCAGDSFSVPDTRTAHSEPAMSPPQDRTPETRSTLSLLDFRSAVRMPSLQDRRAESLCTSPVQSRLRLAISPPLHRRVGGDVPCTPEAACPWEDRHDGVDSRASVADGSLGGVLAPVQAALMAKWRSLVEQGMGAHVQKVVAVDDFKPVGTTQHGGISSSAVDLVLMANRIAVLVSHGIENAFEALRTSRAAVALNPTSPKLASEEHLCYHFSTTCDPLITRLQNECKIVLNTAVTKYASLLVEPIQEVPWDSADTLDYRVTRVLFHDFFTSPGHSCTRVAMRVNNVVFAHARMHALFANTVSSYHTVVWRLFETSCLPHPAEPTGYSEGGGGGGGGGGEPDAFAALPFGRARFAGGSPSEASLSYGTRPSSPHLDPASALCEGNVEALLRFIATKIVFFDVYPELRAVYATDRSDFGALLDALDGCLTQVVGPLVPSHRPLFLSLVMKRLVDALAGKVIKGKMPRRRRHTVSDEDAAAAVGASRGAGPFMEAFHNMMEDLNQLREFFLMRDSEGVPALLEEEEVDRALTPLLDATLLLLSRNPTAVLLNQSFQEEGAPMRVHFDKAQLEGMWLQVAEHSAMASSFLLRYLAMLRSLGLKHAWEEQRAAHRLGEEVESVSSVLRKPSKPAPEANDPKSSEDAKADGEKKGQQSRTCAIQ